MSIASRRLTVTLHRGRAGLAALREEWQRASTALPPRFYCEWGWWDAYLSALELEPERVLFARLAEGATLAAIVPLRERRVMWHGLPVRELALPRHDHLPLSGILHRPGLTLDGLLAALERGLRQQGLRWDVLELSHVLREGLFREPPRRSGWRSRQAHVKTCDQVCCDQPWEAYAATLTANFRSNLNKASNKLAKTSDVRFAMLDSHADIIGHYPHFEAIEASGWKGEAGTAITQDPRLDAFYRRLIDHFAPSGRARMNTLEVAGKMIAVQFCLVDDATLYILKLAYDESFSKLAPGNMLLKHVIASRAFRYVNLVGTPAWFAHWNPEQHEVYKLSLFNTTARGALMIAATHARDVARRRAQVA